LSILLSELIETLLDDELIETNHQDLIEVDAVDGEYKQGLQRMVQLTEAKCLRRRNTSVSLAGGRNSTQSICR
jgi:hypothetical protein